MAQDLMNTQTGGEGETIQIQPEVQTTPDQFDVKIKPIVDSEPAPQVATVPTEEESKIEPTLPTVETKVEENIGELPNVEVQEGDKEKPSVTAEVGTEVPLSDENYSVFTPEKAGIDLSVAPSISDLDLSGFTIDGAPQFSAAEEEPIEEFEVSVTEEEEPEEKIDLSQFTIDGVPQGEDVEVKQKVENVNKQYQNTRVQVKNDGKVVIKPKEKKVEEPKSDGELYTYKDRPGAIFKRKGPNDWYVDAKNTGNFVKITKNAKARIAVLERDAIKIKDQKTKTQKGAEKAITSAFGNQNQFNQNQLLTANGDAAITRGLNFSELTKSNEPTKADRYTNSGQINFGYDPNYANATKEQRTLIDASKKEKPDGYYRFPGSPDLYQKKDGDWLKDVSGKGKKFVPLSKGDVEKREKALEAQAIQTNDDLSKYVASTIKPLKIQTIKSADDLLSNVVNPLGISTLIEKAELGNAFEEAKNFADKDIMMMFAKNNSLSGDQILNLLEQQKQIKKIIGDGKYDDLKGKAVNEILNDSREFFEQSKIINERINEAYSKDMSLDRLALEDKRKELDRALNTYSKMTDFQSYTYDTFKATLKMADFIQDAIEDGKMLYDRENGGYKFSTNITETERKYYEGTLAKYLKEYNTLKDEKFSSLNSEIRDSKDQLRQNLDNISEIKERLKDVNKGSEAYKDLYSKWYELSQENKTLEKEIKDKTSLKSTVFLTEPKKAAVGVNTTESAKNIFNAIPKEISPKQKFDLFYSQLQEKNNQIASKNKIGESLYDQFKRAAVDLLDWGGYFSLTDAEKEWLKNKETLNKLAPLYFNNDYGFTQSSGGFYESFINGVSSFLFPKTSKADNYFSQSDAARTIQEKLAEEGFDKDDVVDENYLNALKEKQNVEFWSREQWGNMTGTTVGVIIPLILTKKVGSASLRTVSRMENLVTKTKNAEKLATYIKRADNIFEGALKSTRYGKYIYNPIKTGLQFEAAGTMFGSTQDELYFLNGFAGGLASEGFTAVMSKLPADRAYSMVQSIFGGRTDQAVNLIKKAGEANVRGATEVAEEFGNELSNIYTDELRDKGFFDAVKEQFGDLDFVQEFVISTYMMGIGMGIGSVNTKSEAYNSLSDEKKKQVDEVLNSVKADIDAANDKVDNYVEEQDEEIEKEKLFEKEPQKETKTNDLGEIEFDAESIKEASEGRPSVVAESKEEPSSFTEPIDFDKLEEYDKEDQAGIPGEERKGEEPIETQPVAEPGQEEVSPSGVVQEEEKVSQEEIDDEIRNIRTESDRARTDLSNKVKSLMDKRDALYRQREKSIFFTKNKEIKSLEEEIDKTLEEMKSLNDKEFQEVSDLEKRKEELNKPKETITTETKVETPIQEEIPITETKAAEEVVAVPEATMFSEASDIKKIRNKQEKTAAETAFQEKHGVSYKKVSNINTNFATIVKNLENNNLIEKEC
jgi:hypothetical protein